MHVTNRVPYKSAVLWIRILIHIKVKSRIRTLIKVNISELSTLKIEPWRAIRRLHWRHVG
jgi:hypothetical protein